MPGESAGGPRKGWLRTETEKGRPDPRRLSISTMVLQELPGTFPVSSDEPMFSGRNSLRYRLPAGIALIVTVAVTVFGALAYTAARRAAENAAWVRARSVADRFAQVARAPLEARVAQVRLVAEDPRVVNFLATGANRQGASAALSRLGPDSGQTSAVGLRDPYGATALSLNRPLLSLPATALRLEDSAQVTALFEHGDVVEYEHISPVKRNGRVIGHVAMRRRVASTPATLRTLTALMGNNAVLLLGNTDGTLWSNLIRRVERPSVFNGDALVEHDGQKWIAAREPIAGTPLSIAVELPHAMAVAPVAPLLWIFGGLAAVVVLAGALAGWLLSGRVTDPLVRLTVAAETITAGQHTEEHPVPERDDEVGRLGRAFGIMARSVEESRSRLEQLVSQRTAELERAQAELIRQEKLAVLGQLASSVGHELRNPLGVMANITYYLNATLPDAPPKARHHLDMLKRQVGLAEKIVSDILDFTRVKPPDSREVQVAPFIDEQLQRVAMPGTISVEREIERDLPAVHADPVQIGQVLYNVLTNAVQAMDGAGGVLTVRGRRHNGAVRIEVADQGPGIPAENRDRVFEPLFTTKQRGIGLGLSVSRSLAQANGGELSVGDHDPPGALFILELPVAGPT
jgi:signal transduction histidine kinase